jgi:hypothetical protein
MKIRQLSVFLENRPGRLSRACRTLADAGISITTATLVDTKEFGILRLIVADPDAGERTLVAAGYAVNVVEVVAVEVVDRAGGLADVLAAMDAARINVEYCYAFTERRGDRAAVVFRFPDPDAAIAALTQVGVRVFSQVDLFASV